MSSLGTKFLGAILTFYAGHNLTDTVVLDFFNLASANDDKLYLSKHELHLLGSLLALGLVRRCSSSNNNKKKNGKTSIRYRLISRFYVIGYIDGDYSTRKHEISHALYALCTHYQTAVASLYSSLDIRRHAKVTSCLDRRGYTYELHQDEFGAYIIEMDQELIKLSGVTQPEINKLDHSFSNQNIPLIDLDLLLLDDDDDDDDATCPTNKAQTPASKKKMKKAKKKMPVIKSRRRK